MRGRKKDRKENDNDRNRKMAKKEMRKKDEQVWEG